NLLKRLTGRTKGDKLAAEFHYRLSTKSRDELLGILRSQAGPPSIKLSLLADDPRQKSEEEIDAPLKEAKKREEMEQTQLNNKEEREQEQIRNQEITKLADMTKEWEADDRDFAADLLKTALQYNLNPDPRGVSDRNRRPILERYERWLRRVDAERLNQCRTF